MKLKFYFLTLCYLSYCTNPLYADIGCFPQEPYLDSNDHEIHDKKTCEDQKTIYGGTSINTCWIDSKNTCYWVGSPAQCSCFQNEGTSCNGALSTGSEFGYCKWGEKENFTGCDQWRLHAGLCKNPGYKIDNEPPTAKDYCHLLGGAVSGENCQNYYNNAGKRQTCSLRDLWKDTCPDSSPKS